MIEIKIDIKAPAGAGKTQIRQIITEALRNSGDFEIDKPEFSPSCETLIIRRIR